MPLWHENSYRHRRKQQCNTPRHCNTGQHSRHHRTSQIASRETGWYRRLSTYLSELSRSQVFRFYSFALLRRFRIQPNRADAIPVARITAPVFRPSLSGLLIERFSCRQYRHIFTTMTLIWCYKSKVTMAVLLVVPRNKSMYLLMSLFPAGEGLRWIRRRVYSSYRTSSRNTGYRC